MIGRRAWLAAAALAPALGMLPVIGRAQAPVPPPATLCRAQAGPVEHAMGLPPGMLLAVGRVESGRSDPDSRDVLPWPWTVNDEGTDHVFQTAFDAIAYVTAARGRGSRSLDVGCFQVNLQFHPDAFATVAQAFDPAANARYAGQLLSDLHTRSGSWEEAVRLYHSATPWRGEAYRDLVLSRWAETSLAPTPVAVPLPLAVPTALASSLAPPQAERAAGHSVVRVEYPSSAGPSPIPAHRGRLPKVITPTGNAGN